MKIKIYDVENLPFGCQVSVKSSRESTEKAVAISDGIALENGDIINFGNLGDVEIYLGWQ